MQTTKNTEAVLTMKHIKDILTLAQEEAAKNNFLAMWFHITDAKMLADHLKTNLKP